MALPTKQKTWIISPCNRITYVSLNDTMGRYLYGIKEHLKANGYTVKGSSNGTTGAMDATDRWTGPVTGTTTRGANTTTVNSWIVLTDGSGANVCFSYVGATDDIARISFSATGNYAAAATATHTPTCADGSEALISNAVTLVATDTTADRVWSCWVANDFKSFRVAIARQAVWVGQVFGVETFTPVTFGPGVAVSPALYGWSCNVAAYSNSNWHYHLANSRGGWVRTVISSVARVVVAAGGGEAFGGASAFADITRGQNVAFELQGGTDFPMKPMSIYADTVGSRGKLGNLIDVWMGKTTGGEGNIYGNGEFVAMGAGGDIVWPWNGTPGAAGTPVVMS